VTTHRVEKRVRAAIGTLREINRNGRLNYAAVGPRSPIARTKTATARALCRPYSLIRTNPLIQDLSSGNNGYIVADRLYDLNPMPPLTQTPPLKLNPDAPAMRTAGTQDDRGDDPATHLQYSAAYGNPYLRPNPAQWLVKTKRKPVVNGTAASATAGPIGPNYHIGVAKRQTLATHV